jgi:hypothetical protein
LDRELLGQGQKALGRFEAWTAARAEQSPASNRSFLLPGLAVEEVARKLALRQALRTCR